MIRRWIWILLLSSNAVVAVEINRGPYMSLSDAQSGQMSLRFSTVSPALTQLDYGLSPFFELGTLEGVQSVLDHRFLIENLPPGVEIFYQVRAGVEVLAVDRFYSKPNTNQVAVFSVIGDFGDDVPATATMAQRVRQFDPRLLVTVGDNVYEQGAEAEYDPNLFQPYRDVFRRTLFHPVVGNHDLISNGGQAYLNNFDLPKNSSVDRFNYSYDYGPIHFACINSDALIADFIPTGIQIVNWLREDLRSTQRPWKVVVFHHPVVSSSFVHQPDPLLVQAIQPVLAAEGVNLVFQGHNHAYERHNPVDGVHYIVTGAGGRVLYPLTNRVRSSAFLNNTQHSFMACEADSLRLTLRCINENFEVVDALQIELDHPFVMDGILDPDAIDLGGCYAALRGSVLYIAAPEQPQSAQTTHVYLSDGTDTTMRQPDGTSAFVSSWNMRVEASHRYGEHAWKDLPAVASPLRDFHSMRDGGSGQGIRVVEGTVNLDAVYPVLPDPLFVARATHNTTGIASQWPASPLDNLVPLEEFYALQLQQVALDFPSLALSNALFHTVGPVSIGSSLTGEHLLYTWTQLGGPFNVLDNPNEGLLRLDFPGTNSPVLFSFELEVADSRFSQTSRFDVTFVPDTDTDGDGLLDFEEQTGLDVEESPYDPDGRITNPLLADSDGDGDSDGTEAYTGTDPNDRESLFALELLPTAGNTGMQLTWPSAPGRTYTVVSADDLLGEYVPIFEESATPPSNVYVYQILGGGGARYFAVQVVNNRE
jgi:hypothetical protein